MFSCAGVGCRTPLAGRWCYFARQSLISTGGIGRVIGFWEGGEWRERKKRGWFRVELFWMGYVGRVSLVFSILLEMGCK